MSFAQPGVRQFQSSLMTSDVISAGRLPAEVQQCPECVTRLHNLNIESAHRNRTASCSLPTHRELPLVSSPSGEPVAVSVAAAASAAVSASSAARAEKWEEALANRRRSPKEARPTAASPNRNVPLLRRRTEPR